LSKIFIFAAGAAIGTVVTWKLLKTKYEQIAQEEIDSVKETFAKRLKNESPETSDPIEEPEVKGMSEGVASLVEDLGYVNYSNTERKEEGDVQKPYVISPEEFGDGDYETVSLTYYADGVLTDGFDDPIEDVEETVGKESLTHFGEYEDDSVFVRNDAQEIDYEILLDVRKYSDVTKYSHLEDEYE
jgi:hypothetical protein